MSTDAVRSKHVPAASRRLTCCCIGQPQYWHISSPCFANQGATLQSPSDCVYSAYEGNLDNDNDTLQPRLLQASYIQSDQAALDPRASHPLEAYWIFNSSNTLPDPSDYGCNTSGNVVGNSFTAASHVDFSSQPFTSFQQPK